jgi:hypothetical protein
MSLRVVLRPEARAEVDHAVDWYEQQRPSENTGPEDSGEKALAKGEERVWVGMRYPELAMLRR